MPLSREKQGGKLESNSYLLQHLRMFPTAASLCGPLALMRGRGRWKPEAGSAATSAVPDVVPAPPPS